jgi:hypothetical protein
MLKLLPSILLAQIDLALCQCQVILRVKFFTRLLQMSEYFTPLLFLALAKSSIRSHDSSYVFDMELKFLL